MTEDKWFRHAIIAMFAGLAWFLATEAMFRFGVERIADSLYLGGPNPLLRLWLLQLAVYLVASTVAAVVCVRVFVAIARDAVLTELLAGVALAGTLRVMVSLDNGLVPHPWWFDVVRFAFITIIPLALAAWMLRRRRR